jgi:hypothetical protein
MYYYVVIQDLEDGTSPMSVTARPTYDEADAQLHYDMWYAKSNTETFKSIKCLILNEQANTVKMDKWNKPLPPPEIIEEPVEDETEEPVEEIEENVEEG